MSCFVRESRHQHLAISNVATEAIHTLTEPLLLLLKCPTDTVWFLCRQIVTPGVKRRMTVQALLLAAHFAMRHKVFVQCRCMVTTDQPLVVFPFMALATRLVGPPRGNLSRIQCG